MATSAANLTANCLTPLGACRLRATKLKAGGQPQVAPHNIVVSDALIDVAAKLNVTKGDSFTRKDGCGRTRVTFQGCDNLDSADLTVAFLEWDPQLWEMATGGTLYYAAGKIVGYQLPSTSADCPNGIGLEVWSRAWDGDQQAVDASTGAPVWICVGFPKVVFTVGDFTLGNDITNTPLVGHAVANSNFGDGPTHEWPGPLTRIYGWYFTNTIPAASCGTISLTES